MELISKAENNVKNRNVQTLILYLLFFYFIWALKELWFIDYFHLFEETAYALLEATAKILVWIVPIGLYVKYDLKIKPIDYFHMNVHVKKDYFGVSFFLHLLVCVLSLKSISLIKKHFIFYCH
ncbi:hypothetical protein [Rummeliibacillus sp. SL167]|uniref:hypothetical protein n=1 Tax=Rummeliibacillus sp. SL167 TaxID=2579792 RepID=UPI0011B6C5F0|nr:hypothetical protein [Rummeliibacillus sp. SL167]